MMPPIMSFVVFNKAGMVAQNLKRLLDTKEDFELYIVDNGSMDDSWKFIETLEDSRIKEKKRFDVNRGCIYAVNYVLSHRKPGQFFIHIDSDMHIQTDDWLHQFMEAFRVFPELGMVGATTHTDYQGGEEQHPLTIRDGLSLYKVRGMMGCFICVRPEIFDVLGYYCEEICGADMEMPKRIQMYTPYELAVTPHIKIGQKYVKCENCPMRHLCQARTNEECVKKWRENYYHVDFYKEIFLKKVGKFFKEIEEGIRTPYCASIHDEESMKKYYYDKASAEENFDYYACRMK